MVPSGPPTGASGAQSVVSSLLRANSGSLGSVQPGSISPQQTFSSLISPRAQLNGGANGTNMTFLGGITNASSLLNHSFGNAFPASGGVISTPQMNSQQRGGMGGNSLDMLGSTESDPISFPSPSGSLHGQHLQNPSGKQTIADHSHSQTQQLDAMQNFQQQVSVPHNQQRQQHRGGLGNVGGVDPVKLEEQTGSSDQSFPGQQLPSIRGIGSVKMEPLQLQSVRSLGPAKMEHQQTDSSLFLQQHQQQNAQQQLLQMSRSAPHASAAAQMSFLQQQRMLLIQQQKQQQHQLFKTLPQRIQLQQQLQHGVPIRPQMKQTIYEPGMCARRLTQYMYSQQHRPEDNNIDFWRKFVAEFFASNAKKRWCVSLYGSGRQTIGVFPQDVWHCEICRRKPGRGFEATVEVLPRLLQIKYASGTLEELLYVDMPRESHTTSGQILLDYAKAVQESVFEQLRVVREGQLRIVFNPDLKISSWEFCARRHEELIPRRLIMHQVSQLGAVVQKHQTASQNASSLSIQDLQTTCNSFVSSARQLAKALEVPLVNDLGYTKRYVRCLQISEVVHSMKDLIDYSRETGTGPMDSLMKFPKRSSISPGLHSQQTLQQDTQQNVMQNSSQNTQSSHGTGLINNSHNAPSLASTSGTPMVGLLHQNSMKMMQEHQMNSLNGVFASDQIPSASSSNSIPPSQPNSSSPFSLTPTSNNSIAPSPHISRMNCVPTDSHSSSVQQILQEMMSSQLNSVSAMTGSAPASLNGGNCLVGNERANTLTNNIGVVGGMSGLRAAMTNNAMNINGRVGINHISRDPSVISQYQQQDMGNRLVRGLGSVSSFDNLQFDWKSSP
ncbi:transcriptional corepressor SEUSS-like isoform X1 [Dendrobium catenatum]|uniref:transcriptional corepressor SEUSS-like isoform X1 n=1 Tax=Dendrobium catenatum TaxID=906689 RepID=UPI0009F4F5E6|nr:transcriptional corepressor SEUSS-like isoform X1 [Dendrobium catenatum]XP_028554033.1 transcriptional corepressor SEUSS-like isoform X1 [Dendrobium catenatum]